MDKQQFLRELNKAAFSLLIYDSDYPAERAEAMREWNKLYTAKNNYGVSNEQALAILHDPDPC